MVPARSVLDGQRLTILNDLRVGTLLDVGANHGTWAREVRRAGFAGRILSFEPNPECMALLHSRAVADRKWSAAQLALGAEPGRLTLNLYEDSHYGSLHPLRAGVQATRGTAEVSVITLDSFIDIADSDAPYYLKIDTQGHELPVLQGAVHTLANTAAVELEFPVNPIYDNTASFEEIRNFLSSHGFSLASIQTERFSAASTVDMDAIFVRGVGLS